MRQGGIRKLWFPQVPYHPQQVFSCLVRASAVISLEPQRLPAVARKEQEVSTFQSGAKCKTRKASNSPETQFITIMDFLVLLKKYTLLF